LGFDIHWTFDPWHVKLDVLDGQEVNRDEPGGTAENTKGVAVRVVKNSAPLVLTIVEKKEHTDKGYCSAFHTIAFLGTP